ncbi:MAG: DUF2520 domain-containing protein [Bacteroidales bacterium]|nr:DUF2520 domain-containing protein [Bacteroidales bacterium]
MAFNHQITIIGSGNVAWHLAHAFKNAGVGICSIISRTESNACTLAGITGSKYSTSLGAVPQTCTLVLICTSDSAIENIARELSYLKIPVAHTSGSIPLSAIGQHCAQAGVFYPVQTFTKNIRAGKVSFPVCIEAVSPKTENMLYDLAKRVSEKVCTISSEKRRKLHLAAVMTNNFTNFLIASAYEFLEQENIDPGILVPLVRETTEKIKYDQPYNLQTGPARRGDKKTLEQHLGLLAGNKKLYEIYTLLSDYIAEHYKNTK